MTKILSILALAAFLMIAAPSTSMSHCGVCEASQHKGGEMKPCTKCVDAGKTCDCAHKKHDKKHKEKTCGSCKDGMKHGHGKKPCKVCEQNDKRFEMDKEMTKGKQNFGEKGTYRVQSRGPANTGYNE